MHPDDIKELAKEIVSLMNPGEDALTMEDAAKVLGLRCTTKQSLSVAFSRFSNPKLYAHPLKSTRVGKERTYSKKDLIEFRKNKERL